MEFLQRISPREYQQKIFETCIQKNCLVVLPTGLGKTLISLMVCIDRLKKFPREKILFLAPTKPLAEQHLKYFEKHLPELFAETILFTGIINAKKRKELWQTAEIIFSTPQCIANDLKNRLYDLSEVSLLIEDEAHRCLKNYDYNFIVKEYKKQGTNQRIIGLTASPGSEMAKIKEICRNLNIEEVELRTRHSEDVKDYLQELEFKKIMIDFPKEFQEIKDLLKKLFNTYVGELKARGLFYTYPTKTELIKLQKKISFLLSRGEKRFNYFLGASSCAQAIKMQHALELLETQTLSGFNKYLKTILDQALKKQSKGVVKLASKPEFTLAFHKSNILLRKGVEHPKLTRILSLVQAEKQKNPNAKILVFTQFRETAQAISKKMNDSKIKSKIFVGQAKKASTGLNQNQQKKIIEEFSEGKIDVLCATCIGEEGLDIPEVGSVIFYEPIPSAIRTIQRAGRTARLMKGKLIMLITKGTRDETNYYVSRSREKKMYSAIDAIKKDLTEGRGFNSQLNQKTMESYL
ncbi:MAG: DEAD/DEAH box helicase [Candidatus Pacearchaeota archaeon]